MTRNPLRRIRFGKISQVDRARWVHSLPVVVLPVRAGSRICGLWFRLGAHARYVYLTPAPKTG